MKLSNILNRKFILIIVLVILCVSTYYIFSYESIRNITKLEIQEMTVEHLGGPTVIHIKDKNVIDELMEKLEVKKWTRKPIWNIKLAPILYIKLDDGVLIGLFGDEEPYAKVEDGGYYKIPTQVYSDIMQMCDLEDY